MLPSELSKLVIPRTCSAQIKTIIYGKVLIVQRPEIIFTALA